MLSFAEANEAAMGEEAATPGRPVALARATGLSPGDFTLKKNRRIPLALPRFFSRFRNSRFSLPHTLNQIVAPGNIKLLLVCAKAVDVSSSLWKGEENLRRNCGMLHGQARQAASTAGAKAPEK